MPSARIAVLWVIAAATNLITAIATFAVSAAMIVILGERSATGGPSAIAMQATRPRHEPCKALRHGGPLDQHCDDLVRPGLDPGEAVLDRRGEPRDPLPHGPRGLRAPRPPEAG